MQLSPIGLSVSDLDTPALLLDLDAFEHNVATMSNWIRGRGMQWRPHAKAYKTPAIAHVLRKAGAIGVTVAKVSEAEVMAAGGIDDILIAHLVVGRSKVDRLAALQRRADVKVTIDHADQVAPLARAATDAGVAIGVLVDVDLGMNRCGVSSPETALALARSVAATPGLRFDGIMGYEGHTLLIADPDAKRAAISEALGRLETARSVLESAGFPCRIVSAGGTGSYQITADFPGVTELQAGGGIFSCLYYTELCQIQGHRPAIGLLATVVSRPSPRRAVVDAGQKALSAYRISPIMPEIPGSQCLGLSAEHGNFELPEDNSLAIGEKVMLVPGYSDFTFVLHDRIIAHRGGRVESVWELTGRGKLQ